MYTYVYVSGGYSMLMFKSFALRNFSLKLFLSGGKNESSENGLTQCITKTDCQKSQKLIET